MHGLYNVYVITSWGTMTGMAHHVLLWINEGLNEWWVMESKQHLIYQTLIVYVPIPLDVHIPHKLLNVCDFNAHVIIRMNGIFDIQSFNRLILKRPLFNDFNFQSPFNKRFDHNFTGGVLWQNSTFDTLS